MTCVEFETHFSKGVSGLLELVACGLGLAGGRRHATDDDNDGYINTFGCHDVCGCGRGAAECMWRARRDGLNGLLCGFGATKTFVITFFVVFYSLRRLARYCNMNGAPRRPSID